MIIICSRITVTLDTDKWFQYRRWRTPASAGKDKVIAYTVLRAGCGFYPESGCGGFYNDGISISAVPYSMSMEFPDMEDQLGELSSCRRRSASSMKAWPSQKGTKQMTSGASSPREWFRRDQGRARAIERARQASLKTRQIRSTALGQTPPRSMREGGSTLARPAASRGLKQLADGLRGGIQRPRQMKKGFNTAFRAR